MAKRTAAMDTLFSGESKSIEYKVKDMLKELILEGQNRYYDCEPCEGLATSDDQIARLCDELKTVALRNTLSHADKATIKDVTPHVLLSWGVLAENNGETFPTNAYALLTGQAKVQPIIQCAVFKGTDRAYFVDRREFSGTLQEQMESAYQYVLGKINRGMKIHGLYRQDVFELPLDSVRELIANSVAHRSYLEPGNIQIAIFDDRLEVTSPGMLLNGVSVEKMMMGYSKIRNRAIANAFAYMKIIEKWGSGIPRIIRECKEYGLPDPEFIDLDGDFRVNMYRHISDHASYHVNETIGDTNDANDDADRDTSDTDETNGDTNDSIQDQENIMLRLIHINPAITQTEISKNMNISTATVKRIMSDLHKRGYIERKGSNRRGLWVTHKP